MSGKVEVRDVIELCGEVVDHPNPSRDSNFFDIGGDSLAALRLSILLEERWGVSVDSYDIMEAPTLGDIADLVTRGSAER